MLALSDRRTFGFTTAGSSGRTPRELLDLLPSPVLACQVVVDIRAQPTSLHTPAWNKPTLARAVEARGLQYVHRPDLGVPKEVRAAYHAGKMTPPAFFAWYDQQVATKERVGELRALLPSRPLFLCTELSPTQCHRHRLALALERATGAVSFDV